MNKIKSNFNEKYGNYLGEVDIKQDKKGNLRFSSTAKPLTTKMDRVKMLGTSLQQEKLGKESIKKSFTPESRLKSKKVIVASTLDKFLKSKGEDICG